MASAATSFKRLFVRNLLWSAEAAGGTLFDELKKAAKARISQTANGLVLVVSAGNGHNAEWEIPKDFSPQDAAELVSELLDRYDEAKAALIAAGTAAPTDTQIHDEMLLRLTPVRKVLKDFTYGRVQPCEVDA